eukprot:Gb_17024 [translate_table: standard]
MIENVSAYLRKVREDPVLYEFQVLKRLNASKQMRKRMISLTNKHFIERWHDEVIGVHSLDDVMGVIVSDKNHNEVILEFRFWRMTQYFVEDMDTFIASMAVLMGTGKHSCFSIHQEPFLSETFPEKPHLVYQSECETFYTNQFMSIFNGSRDPNILRSVLKQYACNIHVGDSQCNDIKVIKAVGDVLQSCIRTTHQDIHCATLCCLVLQRLFASRSVFEAVKTMPEVFTTLMQCMRSQNGVLAFLASVAMRAMLKFSVDGGPMDNYFLKLESANKLGLLNVDNMQQLVAILHNHSLAKDTVLQILGLLEVMFVCMSSEYLENESVKAWFKVLEASIMAAAKVICVIFRCPSTVIFQRNSLLLKSLLTKTTPEIRHHLRKLCLSRCVILVHLKSALFSTKDVIWKLSGSLVYLMIEGNSESRKLLNSLLPKGVMYLYESTASDTLSSERTAHANSIHCSSAWMDTLEILRKETLATPLLVWNDLKRMELQKFLESELDRFYAALAVNPDLSYDSADVELVYAPASEGEGSIMCGVHLELLPDRSALPSASDNALWQIKDPLSLFQSVFQAMVLGFTPFFGHNNLPEVDLRLAAHALAMIYERHSEDLVSCLAPLNVIEIVVGMLREVIESEHQVFVFKLVVFLMVLVESGGRNNVLRFIRAGGMTVLVPLTVLSLAKCCKDKYLFECDAWNTKGMKSQGTIETVHFVGYDGKAKSVRVPAGRAREVLDKALQDGSLDAKEAIQWRDVGVPDKVQLGLALDLLEATLRLSGSDNNVESFPPSAACCSLSREEVLCHLVQILLWAKTPIFGRILEMISYVARVNMDAMKRLYKLGAFEIILWKLLTGDIVDSDKVMIIAFLRQCHMSQDIELVLQGEECLQTDGHFPWHDSVLRLYLPQGLILKLMSEDDSSFKMLLDSDNDAPEVIWNLEMRERLLEYLTNELEPFVKFRASDSLALYIHTPKTPFEYPELAETLFTAPFYLQNLLDSERFPNYQIIDPVGFLSNLMQDLRKCTVALQNTGSSGSASSLWRKEIRRIHLLLQAQAHLLERCTISPLPNDLESVVITLATPAIRTCLAQKDDSPHVTIDILQQTTKILRRFCVGNLRDLEVPQASLGFSLTVLSLGTNLKADAAFPDSVCNSTLEPVIAGSLVVLESLCSTRAGRDALRDDVRWRKGLWWALCSAAGDAAANPPRGPCTASFAALNCLKYFVEDDQYCERCIKQGLYLPLLLLAIPPTDSVLKANDSKSAMLYSAADVLGSLVRTLNKAGQFSSTSRQKGGYEKILRLIPHPLLECSEQPNGPEKFISLAISDIILPTSIWTNDVRAELWLRICKRLEHYNLALSTGNSMSEDEFEWLQSFQYECLKDEFTIGGLFVRGLCSGYIESFRLPEGQSYLYAIQDYLELNLDVIMDDENSDSQDGTRKEATARYLSVLTALRRCLNYAIKTGREDLIENFRPPVLTKLAFAGTVLQDIQVEIALIVKTLSEHQSGRELVLQSVIMKALTVQLWQASGKKGSEQVLMSTLEAIVLLSESMSATISATNCFATSGLLLPLLALFCKVNLPILCSIKETEVKLEPIPLACQLLAAQVIGQLLLAASGIIRRIKLLKDLAKLKSFSNGFVRGIATSDDTIGEATDMYELLHIIEHTSENEREEPIVIKTLLLLLPIELLSVIARDPSEACDLYDGHFQSPRLVWDEGTRLRVESTIRKEAANVQKVTANEGLASMPSWSLKEQHPVFLRWVLTTIFDNERAPLYEGDELEGYAREMYIGGFYIDQFLRNPEFDFGIAIEERFLHEVRKAIIIGAQADGISTRAFDFDDKRRLLLALLLLFKLRPALLLRHSNFDIFLPVYDLISAVHNSEQRGLTQAAILLLHCTATHSDVADCMSSEELIFTLASLLELKVPEPFAGFAGTDPLFCSLLLLLRLLRLSCKAVELALELDVVSKLVNIITASDDPIEQANGTPDIVKQRAIECVAVMSADKRKGQDVCKLLNKLMSKSMQENEEWKVPLADIRDEVVDSKTLNHFLQHRYPSSWWTLDTSNHRNENGKISSDPMAVIEATVTFPEAKFSDFDDVSERNFKHNIAAAAGIGITDVNVLSKRPGSVVIDFEVIFQKSKCKEENGYYGGMLDMHIQTFEMKLKYKGEEIFCSSMGKKMGSPYVNRIAIRKRQNLHVNSMSNSWGPFRSKQTPTTSEIVYIPGVNLQETQAGKERTSFPNGNIKKCPSLFFLPYPQIVYHMHPEARLPDVFETSEFLVPCASLTLVVQPSRFSQQNYATIVCKPSHIGRPLEASLIPSPGIQTPETPQAISLIQARRFNYIYTQIIPGSPGKKFDSASALASGKETKYTFFTSKKLCFLPSPSDALLAQIRNSPEKHLFSQPEASSNEQAPKCFLPQIEQARPSTFIIPLPPPPPLPPGVITAILSASCQLHNNPALCSPPVSSSLFSSAFSPQPPPPLPRLLKANVVEPPSRPPLQSPPTVTTAVTQLPPAHLILSDPIAHKKSQCSFVPKMSAGLPDAFASPNSLVFEAAAPASVQSKFFPGSIKVKFASGKTSPVRKGSAASSRGCRYI